MLTKSTRPTWVRLALQKLSQPFLLVSVTLEEYLSTHMAIGALHARLALLHEKPVLSDHVLC